MNILTKATKIDLLEKKLTLENFLPLQSHAVFKIARFFCFILLVCNYVINNANPNIL